MTPLLAILRHVRGRFQPMSHVDWLVFALCIRTGAVFDVNDEWLAGAGWHGE
jgi:hypothetical protein